MGYYLGMKFADLHTYFFYFVSLQILDISSDVLHCRRWFHTIMIITFFICKYFLGIIYFIFFFFNLKLV